MQGHEPSGEAKPDRPDVAITAARAAAAAIAVAAIAFGLWKVRSIIILLLLALTFAAAMRPGVEWLHRRKVPEPLAILFFFVFGHDPPALPPPRGRRSGHSAPGT